ncbi:MAG TPA: NDP-sugar synthase [Candidatus Binataceae bacterium]|nr:NDP-sugar synthase [Candidatus Binataceae bacterium]
MKVVLFASREIGALAPISEFSCLALLSVACKPLIVHSIEALATAGLTDVIVVVLPDADAVVAALGDGARWGMRFEYVHAVIGESDEAILQRICRRFDEEYLVVRGEVLRTPIITEFVDRAKQLQAKSVTATIGHVKAGLALIKRGASLEENQSENDSDLTEGETITSWVEFPEAHLSRLDSFAVFHQAHMELLAGCFGGLIAPGRDFAEGVKVGCKSNLPADTIKDAPLLIGTRCKIASDAVLSSSVISDDVVIDSGAVLRSAVIMPHTYVGEMVEVENAIVAGDRLVHVDTGVVASVTDSFLLATLHLGDFTARIGNLANRVAGAVLLAATIWLWPIALIAALAENPRQPVRSRLLLGNRRDSKAAEFRAYEFAASSLALRYLPCLLAVVAGHLRLIGEEPPEPATTRPAEGSLAVRKKVHVGLSALMKSARNVDVVKSQSQVPRTNLRRPLAE